MMPEEATMNRIRQEKLQQYIEEKKVATIKELQELVPEVSLMTLHRDLSTLEKKGTIIKHRGGARAINRMGSPVFDTQMDESSQGKLAMVEKAVSLMTPKGSVFFDVGTYSFFMARNMPDINMNIVTTSPGIALELSKLHNPEITLCGGSMNRKNMAASGQNTLDMLDKINIDIAFISVAGCSADAGFTCGYECDVMVKRKVIEKARTTVMMCSKDKFKRIMPYTFATLKEADYIITDEKLPDSFIEAAREAGITVL